MTTKKIKTSDILGDNYYIYELTSSNYTPALNGSITITCTMKDVYGTVASGKSITLYQNGTSKGAQTTNSSGVATWSITCSTAGLQKFNIKDASIEVFVDNKAVSSHQHGNITSDGKITTSHNGTYSTFVGVQDSTGTLYKASKINSDIIIDGTAHANIGSNANDNQSAINTAINTALGNKANSTHSHSLSSLGGTVTVEKLATAESGYLSSYAVKQNGVQVGNTINIPKDFLVKSGSVKTVSTVNNPVSGYSVGDKYIDLVINVQEGTSTDSHIYILVSDLIDTPVTISDVTGLQSALDGKANNNHSHKIVELNTTSNYGDITVQEGADKDGTGLGYGNDILIYNSQEAKFYYDKNSNADSDTGNELATMNDIPNISGKENTSNKVTSISSSSTDTQYPSAKCVYDELETIEKAGVENFYIDSTTDELVLQTATDLTNSVIDVSLNSNSNNAISNNAVTTALANIINYELVSSDYNPDIDDTIILTCTCTNYAGQPIVNKQLTLYHNGSSVSTATTNNNGIASWNIICTKFGIRDYNVANVHCQVKVGGWKTSFSNYDTYNVDSQNYFTIVMFNETTVAVSYYSGTSETVPTALTAYNTEILQDWQRPDLPVTMVDYLTNILYVVRDNANVMHRRSITGASFSVSTGRYIQMQWKHGGLPSTYK